MMEALLVKRMVYPFFSYNEPACTCCVVVGETSSPKTLYQFGIKFLLQSGQYILPKFPPTPFDKGIEGDFGRGFRKLLSGLFINIINRLSIIVNELFQLNYSK